MSPFHKTLLIIVKIKAQILYLLAALGKIWHSNIGECPFNKNQQDTSFPPPDHWKKEATRPLEEGSYQKLIFSLPVPSPFSRVTRTMK